MVYTSEASFYRYHSPLHDFSFYLYGSNLQRARQWWCGYALGSNIKPSYDTSMLELSFVTEYLTHRLLQRLHLPQGKRIS